MAMNTRTSFHFYSYMKLLSVGATRLKIGRKGLIVEDLRKMHGNYAM